MKTHRLFTYEQAIARPSTHKWIDGNEIHIVCKCSCDKCESIRTKRVESRKNYLDSYRNDPANQERHKLYQAKLRKVGKAKTGLACLPVGWTGCGYRDDHIAFYDSVKAFCFKNGVSVNEMVYLAVSKYIIQHTKGVKS